MIWNVKKENISFDLVLPTILGVFAFFLIVGPRALNPENIAWLEAGDPATHYLGWLFYRNSEWGFPVGLNSSYGLEIANSILYSDSNPFLAILFKPFHFLLPETFQYFGIWLLLCFVLQALFGWRLVGLVTSSNLLRLLGAGLIVFAPPMIWRLHGHLSLVGHFLIVASLYLAFNSNLLQRKLSWGLLLAVAALVHAYLLAIVLAIWLVDLFSRAIKARISWRSSAYEFSVLGLLLGFACWQAGYFSVGSGVSSSGFGFYRMNVLSLFDSSGWSYLFRDFPEAAGDYEGFNYLGLGSIFLLVLSFPFILNIKKEAACLFREYYFFFILFTLFFLFAITNSIGVGLFELKYPLPDFFLQLANTFRASGRIFWPVFYVITFLLIVFVIKSFDARTAGFVLGLALLFQIVDTSSGWLPIRGKNMVESSPKWSSPLVSKFWADAATNYQNVRRIPVGNHSSDWQVFAYYAGKHGLNTDSVYLARVDSVSLAKAQQQASESVRNGSFNRDSLYILDDSSFREAVLAGDSSVDLFARVDGFNVVAPGWKDCADCEFSGEEIKVEDLFDPISPGAKLGFDSTGEGVSYLLTGWSSPESWGTWSASRSATIFLNISPSQVHSVFIDFNALISPSHPIQRVDIIVNGVQSFSGSIRDSSGALEFKLPEAAKSDSFKGIKVEFRLPDAAMPRDIGLGDDGRTLAFGLRAITLR